MGAADDLWSHPFPIQSTNLSISHGESAGRYSVAMGVYLAASGVDWSEVHAVRLLGVALGALFLLWAIHRMFGGRK